ncbi:MAG: tetratricopeptide repeat protein [Pirellulales bacterium]
MAAHNLAVLHMERHELFAAERYFLQAVKIRPDHARALNNLGLISLAKRDLPGAIRHFESAIQSDSDFIGARINLCRILLLTEGDLEQAQEHYLRALGVDASVAGAQEQLALDLVRAADRDTAQRFVQEALKVRPQWTMLVNELAWSLATHPSAERRDPARALELAQQAVAMSDERNAKVLDTLAAAYAANNDTTQAVDTAQQALRRARQTGNADLAGAIESRLKLYRQGEAYIAAPEPAN